MTFKKVCYCFVSVKKALKKQSEGYPLLAIYVIDISLHPKTMKFLWKHIFAYLPTKAFTKYLLLGMITMFAEDVIVDTHFPLVVLELVEKEEGEIEADVSEEEEDKQIISSVNVLHHVQSSHKLYTFWVWKSIPFLSYPKIAYLSSIQLSVPKNAVFMHTPRYIYFHSLLLPFLTF